MSRPCPVPAGTSFTLAVKAMHEAQSSYLLVMGADHEPVGVVGPDQVQGVLIDRCRSGKGPEKRPDNELDRKIDHLSRTFQLVEPDELLSDVILQEHPFLLVRENGTYLGIIPVNSVMLVLKHYINRMRTMLNAANNPILEVDREGRLCAMNRAVEKVFGMTEREAMGRLIKEIVPNTGMTEVIESGIPQIARQIEIGANTYVSNRTPIKEDGDVIGAVAVLQDITELEQLIRELAAERNERKLLETFLENTADRVVIIDKNARIVMINQSYCDFLEISKEKAFGEDVRKVIENTRMHVVVKTGIPELNQVHRIKGEDMICNRVPIKIDGKVEYAIGIGLFRDISDLKKLWQEISQLQQEVKLYKNELRQFHGTRYSFESIVGRSPQMMSLKATALKVAASNSTILLMGESGTGKELFAQAIHHASPRSRGPFVQVNCAAVPETLLESELFGYHEGAFTGASKGGKIGKFELADGGTIFLDEIGDMPLNMQSKILRVLQEREIERVGGRRPILVDVRVIAATNRDLKDLVRRNLFRDDLFYRLHVITLEIPALRERVEDIPLLTEFFLMKLAPQFGQGQKRISEEAMGMLMSHGWTGNVRELENILERALNVMEGDTITPSNLAFFSRKEIQQNSDENPVPFRKALEQFEKTILNRALEAAKGDKLKAAEMLKLSKSTLYEKIARYGIN